LSVQGILACTDIYVPVIAIPIGVKAGFVGLMEKHLLNPVNRSITQDSKYYKVDGFRGTKVKITEEIGRLKRGT
jgi:hypothetical protein